MGLLDRFSRKQTQPLKANSNIFSFLFGNAAPDMKGAEYLGSYKGWVYACVTAIAEEVATIDLQLQQLTSDGWINIPNHIAFSTLTDVNPFMSSSDLFLETQSYLELEGNAFWYLPKGKVTKKPAEIWPLDPSRVSVVKSASNFIGGYAVKNERGEDVPFSVDEIIHFKRFNPLNRYRGMGTVKAAALAIDIDTYSAQWNRNFFYNSALPSATLETEGTLTAEQYNRIKAEWESRYKGVENAHKLAVLQGGLHFNAISISQKDMEFLEQRRLSRDEILSIFRVPRSVLGITEDVNRANAEATEYIFAKRVIRSRMQFVVDRLNEFYIPLFGENQKKLRFTYIEPVPKDREQTLKEYETGLRAGYLTINEVRAEEGKKPVQGGDEVYLPVNLFPVGGIEETKKIATVDTGIELKALETKMVEKRIRFITSEIAKRKGDFQEILLQQKGDLLNRLKRKKSITKDSADDIIRLLFENWDDWIGILYKPVNDALQNSLAYSGRQAIEQIGIDITFDLLNPRVMDWLNTHALEHAKSINTSVRDEVATRILGGVEEGLGAQDIAGRIAEFFDEQSQWRALRIARTEVISGYAQGTMEGARQSGVVTAKKWLTAGDDRVDEECAMNEQDGIVGLEQSFSSGDDAPPVHPNCRCVIQLVT